MYFKHNGTSSTKICKESLGSRWQLASGWGLLQISWQSDAFYGLEEVEASAWEIGTEGSVVNNLSRLAVWGPAISSHLDPTQIL
jgi:hypothetical protein